MNAPEGLPRPRWLRPALAGTAVAVGLLTIQLDRCPCPSYPDHALIVRASVAVAVGAWLLEAAGLGWPRPVFAALVILPVAAMVSIRHDDLAPLFLLMLVAWARYSGSRRQSMLVAGAAIAALAPAAIYEFPTWLTWTIGLASIWFALQAIVAQQHLLVQLRAAQADLARQAAATERRRIAREVHDVVAHSLAVTILHLTGARHILGRDPPRAAEALAEAERLGRQSLADVRRTVGLLDPGGGANAADGTATPLPGATDIAGLVADYRQAGLDVQLDVTGDASSLAAASGLGLYRIVQEALANVVKHAPGARVRVDLRVGAGVALRVRDFGRRGAAPDVSSDGGAGLGIVGMRERAALLGGTLTVGPSAEGWTVECSIPAAAADPVLSPAGPPPHLT